MTDTQREAFTERAAIMEYAGGLTRRAATLAAFECCFPTEYQSCLETIAGIPDGETILYEYLECLCVPGKDTRKAQPAPKPRHVGIEGVRRLTAYGVGIKPFYSEKGNLDTIAGNYSTAMRIEPGKRYKAYIRGKFLVIDIDRKDKDIQAEGTNGDGVKNFYAWLASIGKPRQKLPAYLQDIGQGSFPCYAETPSGGVHLFFRYTGEAHGILTDHVEIKTLQISAGYKDGKPYTLIGSLADAPILPPFIEYRLPKQEKPAPAFIPLGKKKFDGAPPWEKIVEFTDRDGRGSGGRNEYAYSLASHAKTHHWEQRDTLQALQSMTWNFNDSFTLAQLKKCCQQAYKQQLGSIA